MNLRIVETTDGLHIGHTFSQSETVTLDEVVFGSLKYKVIGERIVASNVNYIMVCEVVT